MKLYKQISPWSSGNLLSQGYWANSTCSYSGQTTFVTPSYMKCDVGGTTVTKESSSSLSLNSDASWDWGQSIGTWQANHAYSVGDFIRPTSIADGVLNTSTEYATPAMSGNTHNTGRSVITDTTTADAYKCFDQSTSTSWASTNTEMPHWVWVDFYYARIINKYRFNTTATTNYNPASFKLQGSNDNSNWTDLDTRTGITNSATSWSSYYTFSNTTAYRYYRFYVSANESGNITGMRELHLVAQPKLVYKCTSAGTSGNSEPSWGTTVGGTTADSGATWTAYYDDTWGINRAGTDFYYYATSNSKLLLSRNSTYPHGYTANTSRKVGGFHCLCNSITIPTAAWATSTAYVIGNIVTPSAGANGYWYRCVVNHTSSTEPTWTTTIDATNYHTGTTVGWICEQIHPLQGYVTGDLLPNSVWDLNHRADCGNNNGLVYDPKTLRWCGIYLPSGSSSSPKIVNGGTILDTITWFVANDAAKALKMRLPKDWEFMSMARGSNEMTNIYGSTDPVTAGGYVGTTLRRMVSYIGVEGCTGQMWQWIDESSYRFDGAAAHTHACNASGGSETITSGNASGDIAPAWSYKAQTGGKGSLYTQGTYGTTKLIAGGRWSFTANCGSRARYADIYPWIAYSDIGFRLICNSLERSI